MNIVRSTRLYERWLREQLPGEVVGKDLAAKREKMAASAFQFLRATYWRWAETILTTCPQLSSAPGVLAVGDVHVENFGSWRDREGRLVWGVNDFDECAKMPYVLDLLRLAVSAALAPISGVSQNDICASILKGYRKGLAAPQPFVLDRQYGWLRQRIGVTDEERQRFWKKLDVLNKTGRGAAEKQGGVQRYVRALVESLPEGSVDPVFWPRAAGTGSLGRPRWVCCATWQGATVVREAKALVQSAWARSHGGREQPLCAEIAGGRYRSSDPSYRVANRILVRRLAPDDRKIELASTIGDVLTLMVHRRKDLLDERILAAMGRELASIHLGTTTERESIPRDLDKRGRSWLVAATAKARRHVMDEHKEWRAAWPGPGN